MENEIKVGDELLFTLISKSAFNMHFMKQSATSAAQEQQQPLLKSYFPTKSTSNAWDNNNNRH